MDGPNQISLKAKQMKFFMMSCTAENPQLCFAVSVEAANSCPKGILVRVRGFYSAKTLGLELSSLWETAIMQSEKPFFCLLFTF